MACVCLSLLLAGCQTLGPATVRAGRAEYNKALQQTDAQQMLLNVVRARYVDSPYFLQVASITAESTILVGAGANFDVSTADQGDIVSGELGYTERPTIIYQPLTGERFVRQLLTPVDLQTLSLLRLAGWDLEDIFRVFVRSMNGVSNAANSVGPTADLAPRPDYKDFLRITRGLDRLEDQGFVDIGLLSPEDGSHEGDLFLALHSSVRQDPDVRRMLTDLALDPNAEHYRLTQAALGGGGNVIALETRPIVNALFFLGEATQIPESDLRGGIVSQARTTDGLPFDWSEIMDGLLKIHSSPGRPSGASVSIQYRGHWFYVEDSDVESKETLAMLELVFTLKAGELPSTGPVLTLPVSR
jgi:hypothetical protein